MKFPAIHYKYNNIENAEELANLMDLKATSFEKYLKDEEVVKCEVEFEKIAPKQSGQVHRVEMNLSIDGTLYRADATENSFEQAIDEVRAEIDKEIRRAKGKQATKKKKANQVLKSHMLSEGL